MPSGSWSSARVAFLDLPRTVARLTAAAERLRAADPNVAAVVLFGSLAGGTATPASDADLLVVLRVDGRRVVDRVPQYSQAFETMGLLVQVLPWTTAELAERLAAGDPFAYEIVRDGHLLAGDRAALGQ